MILVDILTDGIFCRSCRHRFRSDFRSSLARFSFHCLTCRYRPCPAFLSDDLSGSRYRYCIPICFFQYRYGKSCFGKRIYCPMTVLYIPALLPMIPGMYAYKIVFSLIMFMQNMKVPELQEKYLIDLFTNTIVTCSVIFMLAVGATIPLFLFIKRAFSMTRHEKN